MALDYALLRNLTARELVSALVRDGFYLRRQKVPAQALSARRRTSGDAGFPRRRGYFQDQNAQVNDRAPGPMDGG
jgi:hypothetical protein